MHLVRVGIAFWLLASLSVASAASNYTSTFHEIENLTFYSKNDTSAWAGFVQVEFAQPVDWAVAGSCNEKIVAIRGTDTHMIAAVQTASATGRPVRLYADDAQRLDGVYCILRVIRY